MVLLNSYRVSRVPQYLGAFPESKFIFDYRAFTVYGSTFQSASSNEFVFDSP